MACKHYSLVKHNKILHLTTQSELLLTSLKGLEEKADSLTALNQLRRCLLNSLAYIGSVNN